MSDCQYRKEALNFYDKVDNLDRENIQKKKIKKAQIIYFIRCKSDFNQIFWGAWLQFS